jgi:hypothetical protein
MKKQKPKITKPTSSITKSELDFNTNIFKQYYDETNQKQKPKTASIINNNNKRRNININSKVKETKTSQQQEPKQQPIINNNINVSKSNNCETITQQQANAVEIHPTFQLIQQQQQIEIECKASQNMKQSQPNKPTDYDDKIKKQEEYKQMLDKQIEEQKMYKSQKYFVKHPPISTPQPNLTNYNQFPINNNVSNSIERYQNIMEEFYDTKLKILNEQKQKHEQMLIQRYEHEMNAMLDNKLNQLMSQSDNEINDNNENNAYLHHFENFVKQSSLLNSEVDNKEEIEEQEENIMNFANQESVSTKNESKQTDKISTSIKKSKKDVKEKKIFNKPQNKILKQNSMNINQKKSETKFTPCVNKSEKNTESIIPNNTKYKIKRQTSKPKVSNKIAEKRPPSAKPTKSYKYSLNNNSNNNNNSYVQKLSSQPKIQEDNPKQMQAEEAINKLENIQSYISSLINNYNK